jgi:hypothetical protein
MVNDMGYPEIRTLEELQMYKNELFVKAICPKCNEGWTSLIPNAEQILTRGCIICVDGTDDEWTPVMFVGCSVIQNKSVSYDCARCASFVHGVCAGNGKPCERWAMYG